MKRARHAGQAAVPAAGQAIVELLAAAGLLVAFVVGIVLLGRLQDLQSTAVQASRYAAFERAQPGAQSPAAVADAVRARLFDGGERPIRAADALPSPERWLDANPHWVDWSRRANPLIPRPSDVAVTFLEAEPPGNVSRALSTVVSAFDTVGSLTGRRSDLERRGYHTATVSIALQALAPVPPFDALRLTLTERTTVLGDDWSARGPAQVADRTAALVPGAQLAALRPVFAPLRAAVAVIEPAFANLCLGRIDPELVPADRLGAPGSGPRGAWVAPC